MMQRMAVDPNNWSLESHAAEILPEHIGYNIGDCDLIFAPTLRLDHWFCYVLETKTMRFYVLDSLVDQLTYARAQKVEEDATKPKRMSKSQKEYIRAKERLAQQCRDCIVNILRRVKPEVYDKGQEIPKEVTWAKVHVQADTDSCGVHVLSWLHSWDGSTHDKAGYTMPKLGDHQIRQVKVDCLWWLVAHEQNKHAQKVLSLLNGSQQMKRKKVV